MSINFFPFGKKEKAGGQIILNSKKNNAVWSFGDAQKKLKGDKFSFYLYIFCWLLLIFQLGMIGLFWLKLPPEIPIFYSRPWGEAIISTKLMIAIVPAISFFIIVFNIFVSSKFSTNLFLKRIILIFTFLIVFMCFWDVIKLVGLLT